MVRVAGYADLPEVIGERSEPDGSFSICGSPTVRPLRLGTIDRGLAAALAHYLETVGNAARAGFSPQMGTMDPDLVARRGARAALPAVPAE